MATQLSAEQMDQNPRAPREIDVPAPTAWPFVLAFGFTLMFAGLLTSVSVTLLGAVLAVAGGIGWYLEAFPDEDVVTVPLVPEDLRLASERRVAGELTVARGQCTR